MNAARLLWNYAQARRGPSRWRDRAALEAWQEQKVLSHLRQVLPKSNWLKERFAGRKIGNWRDVPVTEKAESVARFEDWNTAGVTWKEAMAVALQAEESRDFSPLLRGLTVGLSSGTSGGRGLFLASGAEREAWAGAVLGKVLPQGEGYRDRWPLVRKWQDVMEKLVPGQHRIALFLRAGGGLYEAAGKGRVQFRWFDLMRPLEDHTGALEKYDPTVLMAPPSVLKVLAASGVGVRAGKIVSCAETLDAFDRAALERAFGQRVHEVYQATEGFLGASDANGVLRLNEDLMVVEREWQDAERTRFVPVITDFRRTTQPMIRHRLDDVLVVKAGTGRDVFTGLAGVEGRCEDVLWAVTANGRQPVFGDLVVRVLLAAAEVTDFRVRQVLADRLAVALEPDGEVVRRAVELGLKGLWRHRGSEITVAFEAMLLAEAPGMKRRRIRQEWRAEL